MSTENRPPGTACIKSEYLVLDHVREINSNYVRKEDKRATEKSTEPDTEEPRRKKLKGQNKHRPREKRTPKSEKLCFAFGINGSCVYGSSCTYSHDVEAYLSNKPADIGDTCYLFETFGSCQYALSCRFSSKHIVDGKNIVNEEKWNQFKDKKFTLNNLDKDIQRALRKHSYDFKRSEQALKMVCNQKSAVQRQENGSCVKEAVADVKDGNNSEVRATDERLCGNDDASKCFNESTEKSCLPIDEDVIKLSEREIKKIDFREKLYLAPLTTVGNLPFRRICKEFGADITCSEMAMASSILQGNQSEWALLKRHHTEDLFGVQICGNHPDLMTRCSQLLTESISLDFIDINMGCPLDLVYRKGAGCGLMNRVKKFDEIVHCMSSVMDVPLTVKMRAGVHYSENIAHNVIERIKKWEDTVSLITLHGRSREQRYTKSADWDYINRCSELAHPIPLFGSGDVLSYEDYNMRMKETKVSGIMIARGALIKPWIFKEIKQQQHLDISSNERLDILKNYVNYGLEHWGSDTEGVEKTRRFLLEWLSFLHRYIPVGLLEHVPQHINERPPSYFGRNDLETLMASPSCADWVKISEMLLGPVPENFVFLPKHKANAYQ